MAVLTNAIQPAQSKPILKWAGGKTQMIDQILTRSPKTYNKYIEPFFGGGALFFYLKPDHAVIADSNPELINLYQCVADRPYEVMEHLGEFDTDEASFYKIRAQRITDLSPSLAAARTIYLNKTCFNGLYRVNKQGQFNVPFGSYKNPRLYDEEVLLSASESLQGVQIVCSDYKSTLTKFAETGDFVFLDPPYIPISKYSDFKRYTKEQFNVQDHEELAQEVHRLRDIGCYVILTNSNHPLVHQLYSNFKVETIATKRNINSKANGRVGEDAIVTVAPKGAISAIKSTHAVPEQTLKYPSTRWMGSKSKLLPQISEVVNGFKFESALDLFSGSGIISYLFKSLGKQVISNDYLALSSLYSKAMIENNSVRLNTEIAQSLLSLTSPESDTFVQDTFKDLYFSDGENKLIDTIRHNINFLDNPYEKSIAKAALTRACTKKRPRGIFTYVGHRYDDGRKDIQTSLSEHFINAVSEINEAVFSNNKENITIQEDALNVQITADLVYLDPPYFSPLSDNEYVRRYHFIEGLACDWQGLHIQQHTKTKKFKNYPTPFSSLKGTYYAFDMLFERHKDSIILVSYSSNSLPTLDEMKSMMLRYKNKVEVITIDYKYSFGTQKVGTASNNVQEYIFIGY